MSRIFDALQRSGTEQSRIEYPDAFSVVTEVFEPQTGNDAPRTESSVAVSEFESDGVMTAILGENFPHLKVESGSFPAFPSVNIPAQPISRLVFFAEPNGLAAEKFRFLGVRLRQLQQSRSLKRVLITSTIPQEGKSTVAANLSCTLARRRQQRTLLIDGDLRRPTVGKLFNVEHLQGLSEWLQGKTEHTESIHQIEGTQLWLMPAGAPAKNALELMQSGKLASIMQQLNNWFDWIVIDSPPILPLADTSVWMRLADGALLVTREGVTEKDLLKRGLATLDTSKLLGTVLNGSTKTHRSDYYYQPKS
jgi:capsular exopolysaccharide synthesis family protein